VPVLFLVALAADPEQSDVKQSHRAGQQSLSVQNVSGPHRGEHVLTHRWQGVREGDHVLELRVGVLLAPEIVVAVLATPRRVHASCL
jgi:hypothetical protein